MVSLKQRVRLLLVAGALVVSPLGRGFSLHKNDSFLIIEKADIGSIVRNMRRSSKIAVRLTNENMNLKYINKNKQSMTLPLTLDFTTELSM